MSPNQKRLTIIMLLLSSGNVMAQTGDADTTNLGEVIANFLTQPVHLLWLVPLVILFVSSLVARRNAAVESVVEAAVKDKD